MAWNANERNWLKKNAPHRLNAPRPQGGLAALPEYKAKSGGGNKQPAKPPAYKPPSPKPPPTPNRGGYSPQAPLKWNSKELAWAQKHGVNLGTKTAGGLSTNADYIRITQGGGGGKPPISGGYGGGGGGGQWNERELAWAKQHGVNLGQRTPGGLAANEDYKRISAGGGGGGGGGRSSSGGGGGYTPPSSGCGGGGGYTPAPAPPPPQLKTRDVFETTDLHAYQKKTFDRQKSAAVGESSAQRGLGGVMTSKSLTGGRGGGFGTTKIGSETWGHDANKAFGSSGPRGMETSSFGGPARSMKDILSGYKGSLTSKKTGEKKKKIGTEQYYA